MLTLGVVLFANLARPSGDRAGLGDPAPEIVGVTLDGEPFRLSDLQRPAGRPQLLGSVVRPVPRRVPAARDQAGRSSPADGLAIVGVLTDDPPAPAVDFVAEYGATWPTVEDPDKAAKSAYRVVGRPQTYFVDAPGSSAPSRSGS